MLRFKYSGPHTLLARFPVGRADLCASSGLTNESPCLKPRFAIRSKQKVRQRRAPANAQTAHDENFGSLPIHSPFVELEGLSIQPARPRLFVISERQPEPLELPNLLVIDVPAQVDHVGDAHSLESLDVAPFRHCTAKG